MPTTVTQRLDAAWSDQPGILGFLGSVDHKRVGRRYLVTAFAFLLVGGVEALLLRAQLATPGAEVVSAEVYNQLFTMHGTTMILLFAVPAEAAFANYVLPLMLGARDMAFPRLNMFSYWVFLLSGIFLYASFVVGSAPDGGWFAYPPLVLREWSPGPGMSFYAVGVVFLGLSTTAGAINFLVTTFKLRAPGMTVSRIPVFAWAMVAVAFMILFAWPSFTVAPLYLEFSRAWDMRFFDPAFGGDPLLWQHLFWFWGHPVVYVMLLPTTGIVTMVIETFSRRRIVGYPWVVAAILSTAVISFGLWVHHMFVTGLPNLTTSFFSAISMVVVIPSGVQFFAWIATLFDGRPRLHSPMLWAFGEMWFFLFGGISGVMVGIVHFDQLAHDSYFVVAHFHYVLAALVVFGMMAGLHMWGPKITGRMLHEGWAKAAFWVSFVGANLAFAPMHLLGLWGMPRRTFTYEADIGWDGLNLVSTIGSFLFGIGLVAAFANFLWSRRHGREAGDDPWGGSTLEWATTSPPPEYNFARTPVVTDRAPMWVAAEGARDQDLDLALAPADLGHEVFQVAGPEGGVEAVTHMPGPSFAPLWVALSLTTLATAMLLRSVVVALIAVIALVTAVGAWFWPRGDHA